MAVAKIQTQKQQFIQTSPLAGFQYHQGEKIWEKLRINHNLRLVRERNNAYDERAVAVFWQGQKLGYVPRMENTAISRILDQNIPVTARIIRLQEG